MTISGWAKTATVRKNGHAAAEIVRQLCGNMPLPDVANLTGGFD